MTASVVDLRSDNCAAVAPRVIEAIVDANHGTAIGYGADEITRELESEVQAVFEHPDARVFPVATGTAANALGLSAMVPPWGAVWCHRTAHIITNEGGATSMLSAGAVMHPVDGADFLIDPESLETALAAVRWGDNHQSQPSVVSITQPTDMGTVYSVDHIKAISSVAQTYGMRTHIDGARLANAIVAVGATPAESTWRAGASTFTLGATKNGAMSAELIVTVDSDVAEQLVYRTKRAGQVNSKMRFQSAQLLGYLRDGYWLELAGNANLQMTRLVAGLHAADVAEVFSMVDTPQANMLFLRCDDQVAERVQAAGLLCYRIGDAIRLVTNWSTTDADVDRAVEILTQVAR